MTGPITKSKQLFEAFCRQPGIAALASRRRTTAVNRRPDYRVRRLHRRSVIVEVKQVDPNHEERAVIRAEPQWGFFDMPAVVPGKRIRKAIDVSGPQMRTLARCQYPAILLMYDTLPGRSLHTDPYSVLTAMRGLDVIDVQLPADRTQRPVFSAVRPGPGQKLRVDAHTTISAVAIMWQASARRVTVAVFHNRFAAIPLTAAQFGGNGVMHFDLSPDLTGWIPRAAT